jgi:hypothetical protein
VSLGWGGGDHTWQHNHSVTYPYRNKITRANRYDNNYDAWEGESTINIRSGGGGHHSHDVGIGNSNNHGHPDAPTANVTHSHANSAQTSNNPTLTNGNATVTPEVFPSNAYVNFIIKI